MKVNWTFEQLLGTAPDSQVIRATRTLALPGKWEGLGRNRRFVWGEYRVKTTSTFAVLADLSEPVMWCACRMNKTPCNHGLALALLALEHPQAFVEAEPPLWVTKRLAGREKRPSKQTGDRAGARASERQRKVTAGLVELERWLQDLVSRGFAEMAQRKQLPWHGLGGRLVDAQAPEIARRLRALALLQRNNPDWPEPLLRRIARIYLLIQAFKRFEELSLAMQNDLRLAVGWLPEAGAGAERLRDRWLVIGRNRQALGSRTIQRTWLWGMESNRAALDVRVVRRSQRRRNLVVGSCLDAELHFSASRMPLFARVGAVAAMSQPSGFVAGYLHFGLALDAYAAALTANPWLDRFPVALPAAFVVRADGRAFVHDTFGYRLPLSPDFAQFWHLRALSRMPLPGLFGVWDGEAFTPLSVWHGGRLIPLHLLPEVK